MITVTFYYDDNCPACDQVLADLESLQPIIPHQLVKINITNQESLRERYGGGTLPVIEVGPYRRRAPVERQDLQVMLLAAQDRVNQLEKVDQAGYQQKLAHGRSITSSDKISYWISRHYLAAFNFLLLLYVGLPFAAPVMMKMNLTFPAQIIYKVYSPLCHQLAFRSWFLYGEQAYYPRTIAGIQDVHSYEELINPDSTDIITARNFIGNDQLGYKVAFCERDVAIYGMMFVFGVFYSLTGRRLRSVPWYVWMVFGMGPIGLDGVSQLPSIVANLPIWLPLRESTPFLRTLTGGLFGWMTAWYLFPMIEETMRETRRILATKFAVVEQLSKQS